MYSGSPLPTERDRARLAQLAELLAHLREIAMRLEAQAGRERHSAMHDVLRQVERGRQRGAGNTAK